MKPEEKRPGQLERPEEMVRRFRLLYDHHTHTVYSHGKGSIEDNVRAAAAKGLRSVAITDHGPGHLTYGLDLQKIPEIRAEIARLADLFPGVEILLGVEANTRRKPPYLDVSAAQRADFDILLAGYHYGIPGAGMVPNWLFTRLGRDVAADTSLKVKNTDMILHALYENPVDVLTHPGDKGPFDIEDIARACADTGTLLEINGKHAHLTVEELRIAARYDVSFIIGSDAHRPEDVGLYEPQLLRALQAGIDPARIVNIGPAED